MRKPETITSAANARVKELASLSTRKGRASRGSFRAEGLKLLREALECGAKIIRVAVEDDRFDDDAYVELARDAAGGGADLLLVNREVMKKISGMETPPGIIAEIKNLQQPALSQIDFSAPVILACEARDPRNAGLLTRTAAGAGAGAVIFSAGSTDPFHPEAAQSSMGGIFRIPIVREANAIEVISYAKKSGATVIATVSSGGRPASEWLAAPPEKTLFLLGNESAGLSHELISNADIKITLPMNRGVESHNVSVTAGLLLYLPQLARS